MDTTPTPTQPVNGSGQQKESVEKLEGPQQPPPRSQAIPLPPPLSQSPQPDHAPHMPAPYSGPGGSSHGPPSHAPPVRYYG